MDDIWQTRDRWSEEVKALREQMKRSREAGPVLAMATPGKASVQELKQMQQRLQAEQDRQANKPVPASAPDASHSSASQNSSADAKTASWSVPKRTATAQGPGALPQTATGASLWILIGAALLALALTVAASPRRRRIA